MSVDTSVLWALSAAADLDPPPEDRFDGWRQTASAHQIPPGGDWSVWLLLGGRGAGKTFAGARWLTELALTESPGAWLVAAPTYRDCRYTCIEGESGLLAALGGPVEHGGHVSSYVSSLGEIRVDNGAVIQALSADRPDRFRGGNYRGAWCDELAAWPDPDAWDQLTLATRRGDARICATTTPRPTPLVKGLLARSDVVTVRASTFANAANLSGAFLEQVRRQYEGTRLGRQELNAEILDDVEGALWTAASIEQTRIPDAPDMDRVVVAVDPSGGDGAGNDEQGIVTAGVGIDGQFYVLADRSCRLSPAGWGSRAVGAFDEFEADRVVAEANFGGQMVEHTLRTVRADVPVRMVSASRGKRQRAEPVAALYEQGRVHHVGVLAELEDQMCSWVPGAGGSPDRLDALVWALTELAGPTGQTAGMRFRSRRLAPAG